MLLLIQIFHPQTKKSVDKDKILAYIDYAIVVTRERNSSGKER